MTNKDDSCVRCGKCCVLRWQGKTKRCPYLITLSNGKTFCKVYRTRLGRHIGQIDGENFFCNYRSTLHLNFVGCPQNRDEWGDCVE